MRLYAAIDLHSNNGVLSVIHEQDRAQYERRLPADRDVMPEALQSFRDKVTAVAVESIYDWYWLVVGVCCARHAGATAWLN